MGHLLEVILERSLAHSLEASTVHFLLTILDLKEELLQDLVALVGPSLADTAEHHLRLAKLVHLPDKGEPRLLVSQVNRLQDTNTSTRALMVPMLLGQQVLQLVRWDKEWLLIIMAALEPRLEHLIHTNL